MEEIKDHITKLILATTDPEAIHSLIHSLETAVQCHHMAQFLSKGSSPIDLPPDFPSSIDFD